MAKKFHKRRGIALIPTLFTLGNGFCGFVAIAKALDAVMLAGQPGFGEKMAQAAWLIFLAMVFDALDGRVARLTKQTTEFGAQLDSFTDLVSFGVAPAILVKAIYEQAMIQESLNYNSKLTLLLTALFTICAVLRLARFTVTTTPEDSSHRVFSGLPTPAAAGAIAATVLFLFEGAQTFPFMNDAATLFSIKRLILFLPPLLGLLMISKIEYVHLVNRFVRGRKNFNYLVQGVLAIFIIAFWYEWALLLCFFLYLLSGPIFALYHLLADAVGGKKDKKKKPAPREGPNPREGE